MPLFSVALEADSRILSEVYSPTFMATIITSLEKLEKVLVVVTQVKPYFCVNERKAVRLLPIQNSNLLSPLLGGNSVSQPQHLKTFSMLWISPSLTALYHILNVNLIQG